jgi:hypothetical protein
MKEHLWAFNADGFPALVVEAGFAPIGVNIQHVGHFVGGKDWVMVVATTGDPTTMGHI